MELSHYNSQSFLICTAEYIDQGITKIEVIQVEDGEKLATQWVWEAKLWNKKTL